jgi:hypothetical protein
VTAEDRSCRLRRRSFGLPKINHSDPKLQCILLEFCSNCNASFGAVELLGPGKETGGDS